MALSEGGKANGITYATPVNAAAAGEPLKCLCTNASSVRNNRKKWKIVSFPRVMISLALVRVGGISIGFCT